jgi:hypothetical protein
MSVFDADTGTRLPVFAGLNAMMSSGAIRAPETGAVAVLSVEDSLRAGAEPPLHSTLLLDAETAVEAGALREAIVSIASACEVAAGIYIAAKAGSNAVAHKRP